MKSIFNFRNVCVATLLAGAFLVSAHASVVLDATRIILLGHEREAVLKLNNENATPAFVQTWIDRGDLGMDPSNIQVPFTITPPMARIDAKKSQTLRILFTGEKLPEDRESVFWINVVEVPPKIDATGRNSLQLAFRSRIKLFYRPSVLLGEPGTTPSTIGWSIKAIEGKYRMDITNPTVFHASFAQIKVVMKNGKNYLTGALMVPPKDTISVAIEGDFSLSDVEKIQYESVNDYGGMVSGESLLDHQKIP